MLWYWYNVTVSYENFVCIDMLGTIEKIEKNRLAMNKIENT